MSLDHTPRSDMDYTNVTRSQASADEFKAAMCSQLTGLLGGNKSDTNGGTVSNDGASVTSFQLTASLVQVRARGWGCVGGWGRGVWTGAP